MPEDTTRKNIWILGQPSSYFEKYFRSHLQHTKYIYEFETDVTKDPFYHHKPRKITAIEREIDRYPTGCYRWSKSDLRIIYFPQKSDHTIYPLDAATAGSARYKKRS